MESRITTHRKLIGIVFLMTISCNSQQNKNYSQRTISDANNSLKILEHKANVLYEQDSYLAAAKYFDSLIKIDSLNGEYYYKQGYSYAMIFQKDKATEDFTKAIQFKYKVNHSYYNIGLDYLFINDSLALVNFERCVVVDPNYTAAYLQIAECKKRLVKERAILPKK
jgi:tetratricopeptide (TPR) repeat protein